jgi:hypothetical protein
MMHFIARGKRWVAVVSAPSAEDATRIILDLFSSRGEPVEEMEVMEFDPSVSGGVLVDLEKPC